MRFVIKHEIKGRLRVHILQSRMSFAQADTLQYYLDGQSNIVSAKIQERTLDVTVVYTGSREEALKTLENFTYQGTEVPENYLANSGREMNREYTYSNKMPSPRYNTRNTPMGSRAIPFPFFIFHPLSTIISLWLYNHSAILAYPQLSCHNISYSFG